MVDTVPERRLRLGTVNWQRDSWLDDYYPDDLPDDWRLAYYANDCDCVLLPAGVWGGAAGVQVAEQPVEQLCEQLDETPETFRCFVQLPPGQSPCDDERLGRLDAQRTIVLVDEIDAGFDRLAQWRALGPDAWRDPVGGGLLVRWSPIDNSPRTLRGLAEQLDAAAVALVLDGPTANPAGIAELRTLLELMGRG